MGLLGKMFGPPGRDDFAQMAIRALRKAGVAEDIRYDAAEFCLAIGGGQDRKSFLGNWFDEYLAAKPMQRGAVLARFAQYAVAPLPEVPDKWEDALPKLLPRVYDRFYIEALRLRARISGGQGPNLPSKPMAEHLAVALAFDTPDMIVSVESKMLADWGADFESALKASRDNLWHISNEDFRRPGAPALYVSPWQDSHDASRLFLHDLIWQLKVEGKHVAMVPNRDTLLVTGSEDIEGLRMMAEMTEEIMTRPRSMTAIPVVLEEATWEPFRLAPDHPLRKQYEMLRLQSLAADYHQQKGMLEAIYAKSGEDIFVASFNAGETAEGGLLSYAAWSDGVDTLLPKAEKLALGRIDDGGKNPKMFGLADWDRAFEVAARLFEPTDEYPPRYRVRAFPTNDEIKAMGLDPVSS